MSRSSPWALALPRRRPHEPKVWAHSTRSLPSAAQPLAASRARSVFMDDEAPGAQAALRSRSSAASRTKRLSSSAAVLTDAWISPDSWSSAARAAASLGSQAMAVPSACPAGSRSSAWPVAVWLGVAPTLPKARN